MPASTAVITDSNFVTNAGPTAPTTVLANAPAGPIQDYLGNVNIMTNHFKEARQIALRLVAVTDAADPNLTKLNNILLTLV